MERKRTITTKFDLGDGFISYEQTRPNVRRVVTLRLNGKPMGCLVKPQVSHQVAAQMLLQMATQEASETATPVEASMSESASKWTNLS